MGVALKSNMLVVLLQIGLCVGIQPLIGYNYGSGNKKRLMQVFKFTGVVSVMMGMFLTLFMLIARKTMIQVFIDDAEVVAYGIRMVVALQLSAPFIGILFLCINTIQGMGKALPSLDPYSLPSGTDFHSTDLSFKFHVRPGWRDLCPADSGLSVNPGRYPDLCAFVPVYGTSGTYYITRILIDKYL